MSLSARRMIGATLFAVLWLVLARIRPTSTYHLAPLLIAAWPALGERELTRAVALAVFGGLLDTATTALLLSLGWLAGPSLLPWGGAGLESVLAGMAGVLLGITPALVNRLNARRA